MRSGSAGFASRVSGGSWFQVQDRPNREVTGGRRNIEDRLKRHKAAQLADAAMERDKIRVEELLKENADPNAADERGRLPLHAAAFSGASEVIRLLLGARSDPNLVERGGNGNLALQIAAWQGHAQAARVLVDGGACVASVDDQGWSPLCSAAAQGHAATVRVLLQAGADPNQAVVVAGRGTITPLQAAAKGRHVEVAQALREALEKPTDRTPGFLRQAHKAGAASWLLFLGSVCCFGVCTPKRKV